MRRIIKPLNSSVKIPSWGDQTTVLRNRLEQAINYYSALEQPPRSPNEKVAKAMKKSSNRMAKEIEDIVLDIACALGVEIVPAKPVKELLDTGCDATTCGIRYDECNGKIVRKLKRQLKVP